MVFILFVQFRITEVLIIRDLLYKYAIEVVIKYYTSLIFKEWNQALFLMYFPDFWLLLLFKTLYLSLKCIYKKLFACIFVSAILYFVGFLIKTIKFIYYSTKFTKTVIIFLIFLLMFSAFYVTIFRNLHIQHELSN